MDVAVERRFDGGQSPGNNNRCDFDEIKAIRRKTQNVVAIQQFRKNRKTAKEIARIANRVR